MKYVRFDYSAGFCGTDTYEFGKFDDNATNEEISYIAKQICEQWCETYGVYEDEDEDEDVEMEYDCSWKEVSENEVEMNNCFNYTNWV